MTPPIYNGDAGNDPELLKKYVVDYVEPVEIKVFGENAEKVQDGEEFVAKVSHVEGRKVVTIVRK